MQVGLKDAQHSTVLYTVLCAVRIMNRYFVYLIKSQNRLVITKQQTVDNDYHMLMNNDGGNDYQLLSFCKLFCLGYIYGAESGKKPINSPYEFQ